MARSGYTRSAYSAVSHLLASFRDDEALRRNPLVSRYFESSPDIAATAVWIRSLIVQSIDRIVQIAPPHTADIAVRRREILVRYDLEGATRQSVCAETGITERQLYRDRRVASEQLAGHLRDALPTSAESTALAAMCIDPAELALQSALHMVSAGATASAHARAQAVVYSGADAQWRTVALCLLAQLRMHREDYRQGAEMIDAAEHVLEVNSGDIGSNRAAAFRAFFEIGRGRIAWANGDPKQALILGRTGIDRFFQDRSHFAADPLAQIILRDAMHAVSILTDAGDISGAEALLGAIRNFLGRLPGLPDCLDLEWRTSLAQVQTLIAKDHSAIAQDSHETMLRAQRLGLPGIASDAALLGGWIAARQGAVEMARQLQSAALAFADAHDSPWTRSVICAGAALIERKIGTPERALTLARTATRGFVRGTAGHAFASYILARAELASGAAEEAFDAAKEVVGASAPREYVRGAAFLVMAESDVMLGRKRLAVAHTDEAVDLLSRYGQTYLMHDACALQARVREQKKWLTPRGVRCER